MDKRKKIIIKRIIPSKSSRKEYSLEEILKAAKRVKEAMEREEKKYGPVQIA